MISLTFSLILLRIVSDIAVHASSSSMSLTKYLPPSLGLPHYHSPTYYSVIHESDDVDKEDSLDLLFSVVPPKTKVKLSYLK